MNDTPEFVNGKWTCPPGYAHSKCYGCGHNYFGSKPRPTENGKPADGGLCNWCLDELD